MGPDKGGRAGRGRKASARTQPGRGPRKRTAATEDPSGPSRLLLTRLIRKGAIWNVYVSTSPRSGEPNVTELEFEDTGANPTRYRRRVDGPLLEALHNGAPVSRSSLQDELELALTGSTAADGTAVRMSVPGGTPVRAETPVTTEPTAPDDTSIRSA